MTSDEIIAFYGSVVWILMLEIPPSTHRDRERVFCSY